MNLFDIVAPLTIDEAKRSQYSRSKETCQTGYHKQGTKPSPTHKGITVNNCVPNESVTENSWSGPDNAWSSEHNNWTAEDAQIGPDSTSPVGGNVQEEQNEEWTVAIDGKPWKTYSNYSQATKAAQTIEKKYGKKTAVTSAVIQTSQAYNNGQADKWHHRQPGDDYAKGTKEYQDYIDGYSGKSFTKQDVAEGANLSNLTPDQIKGIGMMIQNGYDIPTIIRIFDNKPTAEQITAIATANMQQGVAEGQQSMNRNAVIQKLEAIYTELYKDEDPESYDMPAAVMYWHSLPADQLAMEFEDAIAKLKQSRSGVAEAQTDYQKRRQRERDVDAGKPVAKQRQSKMTDYQKRRAEQKRQEALGEMDKSQKGPAGWNLDDYDYSKGKWTQGKIVKAKDAVKDMSKELNRAFSTEPKGKKSVKESYWTKLQNERSTKLNSLVNELAESINK